MFDLQQALGLSTLAFFPGYFPIWQTTQGASSFQDLTLPSKTVNCTDHPFLPLRSANYMTWDILFWLGLVLSPGRETGDGQYEPL